MSRPRIATVSATAVLAVVAALTVTPSAGASPQRPAAPKPTANAGRSAFTPDGFTTDPPASTRKRAIADFGRVRIAGFLAWLLWLFIHILYLAGFRNRLSVLLQWAYAYFTYQRGVRLITDSEAHGTEAVPRIAAIK